jgi:hypothetical protein
MHKAEHTPINEISLKEGYEHGDMRPRLIIISMTGIGVLMFGACLIIVLVMGGFDKTREPLTATEASPLQVHGPFVEGYDGPIIEVDPRKERDAYLTVIKEKLNSYGMVSEQPGMERAHIPIEEAMKRLAAGEVPYKKEPQTALVN